MIHKDDATGAHTPISRARVLRALERADHAIHKTEACLDRAQQARRATDAIIKAYLCLAKARRELDAARAELGPKAGSLER
jgi:hypothetical protein